MCACKYTINLFLVLLTIKNLRTQNKFKLTKGLFLVLTQPNAVFVVFLTDFFHHLTNQPSCEYTDEHCKGDLVNRVSKTEFFLHTTQAQIK